MAKRRCAHQRDREREQGAPADAVADDAQGDAADRTRDEPQREHGERQQLLSCCARLRKELTTDVSGKVAVDREVEPLDHVANQSGERRPERRLTRDGHALGQPGGFRRPRGRLVNHTHLGECDQSLSLALPAQCVGALTLSS